MVGALANMDMERLRFFLAGCGGWVRVSAERKDGIVNGAGMFSEDRRHELRHVCIHVFEPINRYQEVFIQDLYLSTVPEIKCNLPTSFALIDIYQNNDTCWNRLPKAPMESFTRCWEIDCICIGFANDYVCFMLTII